MHDACIFHDIVVIPFLYIYRYIEMGKKQRDCTFIPTSLFRDYSLIFIVKNFSNHRFSTLQFLHNRRSGKFQCFVQLFRGKALFLWRHEDMSSLR